MNERRRISIGWAVVVTATGCFAQESAQSPEQLRAAVEKRQCSPEVAKSLLKERPSDDYVDWSFSELPTQIKASLDGPLSRLSGQANPHKTIWPIEVKDGADLAVRVFAARDPIEYDLVEYRWTYDDRPLRMVQSLNAMKVEFDLNELPDCQTRVRGGRCIAAVKTWIEDVFRLEQKDERAAPEDRYKVEFPWPEELRDGIWFSSGPEQNLMRLGRHWWARLDVFVENGALSVQVYKKPPAMMGYPDGSKWFDSEFRTRVFEAIRERGAHPDRNER